MEQIARRIFTIYPHGSQRRPNIKAFISVNISRLSCCRAGFNHKNIMLLRFVFFATFCIKFWRYISAPLFKVNFTIKYCFDR